MHTLNMCKSRGSMKICWINEWGILMYTQVQGWGGGKLCVIFSEDTAKIEVWIKYMSGLEDTTEVSRKTC